MLINLGSKNEINFIGLNQTYKYTNLNKICILSLQYKIILYIIISDLYIYRISIFMYGMYINKSKYIQITPSTIYTIFSILDVLTVSKKTTC